MADAATLTLQLEMVMASDRLPDLLPTPSGVWMQSRPLLARARPGKGCYVDGDWCLGYFIAKDDDPPLFRDEADPGVRLQREDILFWIELPADPMLETQQYTFQDILIELGYYRRRAGPGMQLEQIAPANLIRSVEEQLRQLRKTHTKHKPRRSGDGDPYQTKLQAKLIEGIHWRRFADRVIYTAAGREEILARIKPYSQEE